MSALIVKSSLSLRFVDKRVERSSLRRAATWTKANQLRTTKHGGKCFTKNLCCTTAGHEPGTTRRLTRCAEVIKFRIGGFLSIPKQGTEYPLGIWNATLYGNSSIHLKGEDPQPTNDSTVSSTHSSTQTVGEQSVRTGADEACCAFRWVACAKTGWPEYCRGNCV